ncbi:hypothetical protein [Clostridium sp.]|uniref:hypothetical protein n=1 Tax=Clostridium sp. TaxID=1506 RepID=UPI001B476979|nr:hypothetical protein [Clostridium sp.]MBP3916199.1 hypothetical protein [Clostridium sp.]
MESKSTINTKSKKIHHNTWTQEEIDFLKNNVGKMTINKISKALNKTYDSVRAKQRGLKLSAKPDIVIEKWSEEDCLFLKENYKKLSTREISAKINKSVPSIHKKLIYLEVNASSIPRPWTAEDINFLKNNVGKYTLKEIAIILQRSYDSVVKKHKSIRSGDVRQYNWTQEEVKLLIENHNKMSNVELSKLIGRTANAIYLKKKQLNLSNIQRKWSDEEIDYLELNWGVKSINVLCKRLNRSKSSITRKAQQLKLGTLYSSGYYLNATDVSRLLNNYPSTVLTWMKKKKLKSVKKNFMGKKVYVTSLSYLEEFLKNNLDSWNSSSLPYGILGINAEDTWLKSKRQEDLSPNSLRRRAKWSNDEDKKLTRLYKSGLPIPDICKELRRTDSSVRHRIGILFLRR